MCTILQTEAEKLAFNAPQHDMSMQACVMILDTELPEEGCPRCLNFSLIHSKIAHVALRRLAETFAENFWKQGDQTTIIQAGSALKAHCKFVPCDIAKLDMTSNVFFIAAQAKADLNVCVVGAEALAAKASGKDISRMTRRMMCDYVRHNKK